jgi:acylphosphatase
MNVSLFPDRIQASVLAFFSIFVLPMHWLYPILLFSLPPILGDASGNEFAASAVETSPYMVTQRIHVFFTGKVQGVGFRQSVHDYAVELGLKGWVKNLEDERVEMVAEGNEDDLNLLLGKICSEFEVKKAEVKKEKYTGNLKGFEIVR